MRVQLASRCGLGEAQVTGLTLPTRAVAVISACSARRHARGRRHATLLAHDLLETWRHVFLPPN